MKINTTQLNNELETTHEELAEFINLSAEDLEALNHNLEYLGTYVHLSNVDHTDEYNVEDLLKATSYALMFLFVCEKYSIKPASFIVKLIKNTLEFKKEHPEMFEAANND